MYTANLIIMVKMIYVLNKNIKVGVLKKQIL